MSWALASFVIVALALIAGFAWYERSRPPARVLALVAALAALAVAGRIAFAALPNVKPTTDIVLLAGFSLGGAPGFAVGAVSALVSNLFFGQGPWTPWQMAAWGGVGIFGAALGRIARGRDPGRWALAGACALAGAGFGAVMDLYQWTLAAEQTLAAYVAIMSLSLYYNAAHVIGNVVFCLVIGPPLVRALRRYRRRFEVRWSPPATRAAALSGLVAVALSVAGAPAAQAATPTQRAAAFLVRAQNSDGGFGGARGQRSNQLFTGWVALGLAASGANPLDVRRRGRSPVDFVRAGSRSLADSGELERTILVLRAAGLSPLRLGRARPVTQLRRRQRRDGSFERAVNLTAFGVLALRAGGEGRGSPPVRGAVAWLVRRQGADGGFGFAPGSTSDVDSTGAVLQALAAGGRARGAPARRATSYLQRSQAPSGGFGMSAAGEANAQSTAWAVQGLVAVGRDPERMRRGSRTPLGYLRSLQGADGGVRYSRTSAQTPVWVTAQALLALRRKTFPLAPVARRRARATRAGAAAGAGAVPRRRASIRPRSRDETNQVRSARARDGSGRARDLRFARPAPSSARRALAPAGTPAAAARPVATRSAESVDRSSTTAAAGIGLVALLALAGLLRRRARRGGSA